VLEISLYFLIEKSKAGCELSSFTDTFWNTESLSRVLKSKRVAKVIAMVMAAFG